MIVNKVTTGFVIQEFDTETRQFTHQTFIAGDEVDYEDASGQPIEPFDEYLPFEMEQPLAQDAKEIHSGRRPGRNGLGLLAMQKHSGHVARVGDDEHT